jgi:hypothetical protein
MNDAWALLLAVIRTGGDMASRHWLKDRKIFTTEAPRPGEASTGGRISILSFTDFSLIDFSVLRCPYAENS